MPRRSKKKATLSVEQLDKERQHKREWYQRQKALDPDFDRKRKERRIELRKEKEKNETPLERKQRLKKEWYQKQKKKDPLYLEKMRDRKRATAARKKAEFEQLQVDAQKEIAKKKAAKKKKARATATKKRKYNREYYLKKRATEEQAEVKELMAMGKAVIAKKESQHELAETAQNVINFLNWQEVARKEDGELYNVPAVRQAILKETVKRLKELDAQLHACEERIVEEYKSNSWVYSE